MSEIFISHRLTSAASFSLGTPRGGPMIRP
jgi:hypothetical protein